MASQQILARCMALPVSLYKSRVSKRAHAAEISVRFSEKLKNAVIGGRHVTRMISAPGEMLSRDMKGTHDNDLIIETRIISTSIASFSQIRMHQWIIVTVNEKLD